MDQELLVNEQIDAGLEFLREFNEYFFVSAAFWINSIDSGAWILYVASSEINDDNFDAAYGEVLRLVGTNKNQWLDAFQIKLLKVSDPLVAEVVNIRDQYSSKNPVRHNGSAIAGRAVRGTLIYPSIAAASAL
ncbi:MAG: hypothetical protein D3914_07495 [Candidatus Electrothrix sp. LOE2]|nr:hypothetical protein [Candidatus Electrothrix sp. LOE2]